MSPFFLPPLWEPVLLITHSPWEIVAWPDVTANASVGTDVIWWYSMHRYERQCRCSGELAGTFHKPVICMQPGQPKIDGDWQTLQLVPWQLTQSDSANAFSPLLGIDNDLLCSDEECPGEPEQLKRTGWKVSVQPLIRRISSISCMHIHRLHTNTHRAPDSQGIKQLAIQHSVFLLHEYCCPFFAYPT